MPNYTTISSSCTIVSLSIVLKIIIVCVREYNAIQTSSTVTE